MDDYVVIGGGLVGLATAYQLLRAKPGVAVSVLEKEDQICAHQSTRNSGVLHCGLSYKPGSEKARLANRGTKLMKQFCDENGIRYEICGKLIVATSSEEAARLEPLRAQGEANGLVGLRILSHAQAREIEPHVGGVGALQVPEEGIADYGAVGRALATHIEKLGGRIVTRSGVRGIVRTGNEWILETESGERRAKTFVACAGLYADRICRMAGEVSPAQIVPFRGEYYRLIPSRTALVRGLIYPLPDPTFPFLGVHLTKRVNGEIDAGPNAILALAREGYTRTTLRLGEALEAIRFSGVRRFVARHPRHAWNEVRQSLSKGRFTRALQRLVPEISAPDLVKAPSGVRAQAMRADGSLVQDFLFHQTRGALHVINAPSPAATASLAIGEEIVKRILG